MKRTMNEKINLLRRIESDYRAEAMKHEKQMIAITGTDTESKILRKLELEQIDGCESIARAYQHAIEILTDTNTED